MLYYEQNLIIPREDKFKCLVTILYTSAMPIVSIHLCNCLFFPIIDINCDERSSKVLKQLHWERFEVQIRSLSHGSLLSPFGKLFIQQRPNPVWGNVKALL